MKQARWFGALVAVIGFVALFWPLAFSLIVSNPTATLWIYGVAIIADLALLVLWLVLAIRYSQRAGNAELFNIPWIARMTGRTAQK
jgi:hypothetical protein